MSCHQNISSEELLNELLERVNRQEIKTYSQYLYNTQKYEIRFYTAKEIVAFRND